MHVLYHPETTPSYIPYRKPCLCAPGHVRNCSLKHCLYNNSHKLEKKKCPKTVERINKLGQKSYNGTLHSKKEQNTQTFTVQGPLPLLEIVKDPTDLLFYIFLYKYTYIHSF